MAAPQIISLGIGSPAGIPWFLTLGLGSFDAPPFTSSITILGRKEPSISLSGRKDVSIGLEGESGPSIGLEGTRI